MRNRTLLPLAKILGATLLVACVAAQAQDAPARLVDEALLALPEPLRDAAAVVRFVDGEQIVLRSGDNGIVCRADDPQRPGIDVWCYHESHDDYARRWFELAASGMNADAVNDKIVEEIENETLRWPDLAVNYNLRGPSLDTAMLLTVIYMPYATGEAIGITEERQFERPWLMYPGTAFAHVMIPGQ